MSPIHSAAAEAECLEVVDKVISEFRGMRGTSSVEYEFHVSHETGELLFIFVKYGLLTTYQYSTLF